jgi:hypothetical protein
MRNLGLGLALVACAQISLLSSPAFGANASSGPSSMPVQTAGGQSTATEQPVQHASKKTGWVVLGVGAAITVAGIVIDIVGATKGSVSGAGGLGDNGGTSNARTNFEWGGTALIVAGVVTGIIGGSMIAETKTATRPSDDEIRRRREEAPGGDASAGDGATRSLQAAYQSAPVFSLPLLGATF